MTDPETKLAALWAQDAPPERDPVFVVAVMERAARRRLAFEVAGLLPGALAATAVLWAAGPVIMHGARVVLPILASPALAVTAGGLTLAATLWLWLGGRWEVFWAGDEADAFQA